MPLWMQYADWVLTLSQPTRAVPTRVLHVSAYRLPDMSDFCPYKSQKDRTRKCLISAVWISFKGYRCYREQIPSEVNYMYSPFIFTFPFMERSHSRSRLSALGSKREQRTIDYKINFNHSLYCRESQCKDLEWWSRKLECDYLLRIDSSNWSPFLCIISMSIYHRFVVDS